MKIKNLLLIVFAFAFFSSNAQIKNKRIEDIDKHQEVLIGECSRNGLIFMDFGHKMKFYYEKYELDVKTIAKIKKKIDGIKITIILGTWCKDSKEQVPKFLKILDELKFKDENLTIIGVDSKKQAYVLDVEKYNIERVPTFIFYKKDKEVGKIIETPKKSLEKDMLKKIR